MTTPLSSKEKLALALEELTNPNVPNRLIRRVRRGEYSEVESEIASPKQELFLELTELGQTTFAQRIASGEFDDTAAEIKEWLKTNEGFRVLRATFPAVTRDKWKDILK